MSLLLDALKKSGQGQNAPDDAAPGLSLEELPTQQPQPALQAQSAPSRSEPARDAGKNLFAAKKTSPAKGKIKLGIVPIALIAGTVIGSAYGYYVWREISGPPVAVRPAPPRPIQPPQQVAVNTPPPAEVQTPAPPVAHVHAARKNTAVESRRRAQHPKQPFTIEKHLQPDTITPLLEAAYRAYRSGDYATAQNNYGNVLHQDDKNRDALLGMAAIAQQQKQDALAAQYYGQLLALDPRDALANAGMSALGKGGQPDKETRLKLLIEQQPGSSALHFALGNHYAEQSRWPEAQQAYFDAYSLQPDAAQYAYNLAISLDHLGQAKLAAQYYRRALQLDGADNPNSGNANFDHTQAQQRLDELKAP